jgi:surface protein
MVCISNATSMSLMFCKAKLFNQDISSWDVLKVRDMSCMFAFAVNFNQDVSTWRTGNVVSKMDQMFENATLFHQDMSLWDTSNVTYMAYMFNYATSFNQDISSWDTTSSVTGMNGMFCAATSSFNQDISEWNVSNVRMMDRMFCHATSFHQNLSPSWEDTANVTDMTCSMFKGATLLNHNILVWNALNVRSLKDTLIFKGATSFTQNLS